MASPSEPEPVANSLGLNFDQLKIQDPPEPEPKSAEEPAQDADPAGDKKKPYVNPERVKTGGNQRDKLSEEALSERMARMREQNEKIKQRRLDVQADEEAFKKTQESERIKLAQSRKVQERMQTVNALLGVDRTREQNAKRKLDKMQNREWDSGKPVGGGDWKQRQPPKSDAPRTPQKAETSAEGDTTETKSETSTPASPSSANDSGNWTRGGPRGSPRGRGSARGRGRGRGGAAGGLEKPTETQAPPKDAPPHVAPKEEAAS
ncbi:hypothetical protein C8R45DRAFT_1121275 [Mycena sanguinolenta]|nr:hypothetical protein C8R45DRAFT_1121275 [Mycena sanguinolenta]